MGVCETYLIDVTMCFVEHSVYMVYVNCYQLLEFYLKYEWCLENCKLHFLGASLIFQTKLLDASRN